MPFRPELKKLEMERGGPGGWFLIPVVVILALAACGGEPAPTGGGRIAFESDRDGNLEIYVMNADGSGQTNLTDNPADDWAPAWSPKESGGSGPGLGNGMEGRACPFTVWE